MFGLAIGVHLLNLLTLPFVALIIYFKRFKFSPLTFILTTLITIITFLIIYIGIIKGIPDITNKLGNLYFIIFFVSIIIISIILLQLSSTKNNYLTAAFITSIVASISIILLMVNSLFIKSSEEISLYKQLKIVDVQEKIDHDRLVILKPKEETE